MFVNIVRFPKIRKGKDQEFRDWFTWSNEQYSEHRGFIRRRLLRPSEGGEYLGLVEHESRETFMAMHTSPTQAQAHERVEPFFEGGPSPEFFETVIDSARKG